MDGMFVPSPRWAKHAAYALILFGALPRLSQFLCGRALWLDEAQLCANVAKRGFGGLIGPLADNQVAPTLYLFAQKLGTLLLGVNVYAVRLPSIVGGLLLMLLAWWAFRRMLDTSGALLALAFVAVSQHLISYAGEAKPYSTDAMATVLVLVLALRLDAAKDSRRASACFALAGSLLVWFSYPCVFVLGGVGGVQILWAAWRRDWRRVVCYGAAYGAAALSFLLHYLLIMRPVRAHMDEIGYLSHYWRHGFMPFPPRSFFQLRWFRERCFLFLEMPGGFALTGLALFALLAGAVSLFRRNRRHLLMVLAPFALVLLASGLRAYPFHHRMTLFLAPLAFLLVGQGVAYVVGGFRPGLRGIGAVLVVLLMAQPAYRAAREIAAPTRHHELGEVIRHAHEDWQEGDVLCLRYSDALSYIFLEERLGLPRTSVVTEKAPAPQQDGFKDFIEEHWAVLRGARRVWVAMTYDDFRHVAAFVDYLEARGDRLNESRARGAAVFAYRF